MNFCKEKETIKQFLMLDILYIYVRHKPPPKEISNTH